ncbi:helix-turn-helix transcriptional regulator [Burkholderia cepacia]|uniref:helix-turn-helix domain-containing protein n=1 Tax=Burkholderia cepacia TaxID=292 RepID=UPI0026560D17|nr:helix-turn-helix transcriptional regulator [Burkholderia cepacia]MDN7895904.1 helix-turn-helix transcriptional regulator [Burkholderia cepacia]
MSWESCIENMPTTTLTQSSGDCSPTMRVLGYFPSTNSGPAVTQTEGWIVCAFPVTRQTFEANEVHAHPEAVSHRSRPADIVAKHEANPSRKAALERARARLGKKIATVEGVDTLTSLRLERGLSQSRLADLIGSKQPYIARLEKGEIPNVSATVIRKLREALGVTADQIIDALAAINIEEKVE